MKGIKIDHITKTITITKAFKTALSNPTSPESEILAKVQKNFPSLMMRVNSPCSPKKCNPAKGLTYANMERYIKVFRNADELLEQFGKIKELAAPQPNSYLFVKNWFCRQFPNYKELPDFGTIKLVEPISIVPPLNNDNKTA